MKDGYIGSFDPGGITGFSVIDIRTKSLLVWKELNNYKEIYEKLYSCYFHIVYEDYRANVSTRSQIYACKLCGFIQGICEIRDLRYTPQMPSVRKGFIKEAKELSSKHEIKSPHIIDSIAHGLRYIYKNEE